MKINTTGIRPLLRVITIDELEAGMFVQEILPEPGCRLPRKKSGHVRDGRIIAKFKEFGVRRLIIDTTRSAESEAEERAAAAPDEGGAFRHVGSSSASAGSAAHAEPQSAPSGISSEGLDSDRNTGQHPQEQTRLSRPWLQDLDRTRGDEAIASALTWFAEETSEEHRTLGQEWFTAKEVFSVTVSIMNNAFQRITQTEDLDLSPFMDASRAITKSLHRNRDALIWLGKMRRLGKYAFEHAVNCGVLMGVFCQSLKISREETEQAILGAMLQNIGEARLPPEILGKNSELTPAETVIVQGHVHHARTILEDYPDLPKISRNIILQHHERMDGSGYPDGLEGDEISRFARMTAIIDTYDALATRKVYRNAIPPSQAMKIILEDSPARYDEALVHQFIRCMGIYPTGSLVRLGNDMLAVVMEQNRVDSLLPTVKVIFNTKTLSYVQPYTMTLSGTPKERITGYEDPRKHDIDVTDFMPADDDFC